MHVLRLDPPRKGKSVSSSIVIAHGYLNRIFTGTVIQCKVMLLHVTRNNMSVYMRCSKQMAHSFKAQTLDESFTPMKALRLNRQPLPNLSK